MMLSLQTIIPNIPRRSTKDMQTATKPAQTKTIGNSPNTPLKQGASSHTKGLPNIQPTSKNGSEITPTSTDVLLGRGGLTNRHQGNAHFRLMVEAEKQNYKSLGEQWQKKCEYSKSIMKRVSDYGGRFLKKDEISGKWIEADERTVRKKCSQALRERPLRRTRTKDTNVKRARMKA